MTTRECDTDGRDASISKRSAAACFSPFLAKAYAAASNESTCSIRSRCLKPFCRSSMKSGRAYAGARLVCAMTSL